MYKYILQGAGDLNWMALFALLTFVFIFLVSVIMIFGRSKAYINKMSHLPLEEAASLNPEKRHSDEK